MVNCELMVLVSSRIKIKRCIYDKCSIAFTSILFPCIRILIHYAQCSLQQTSSRTRQCTHHYVTSHILPCRVFLNKFQWSMCLSPVGLHSLFKCRKMINNFFAYRYTLFKIDRSFVRLDTYDIRLGYLSSHVLF